MRRARAERRDQLPVRTVLEDPQGLTDHFHKVIETSLDEGWWLVYVATKYNGKNGDVAMFNGGPVEINCSWTAGTGGGIGTEFRATINNSEVFAIYATNLVITARNTSFDDTSDINVQACPVINHVPSEMFYDEPFEPDNNQIVLVPRFATRFKVDIDDPALIGTVTVQIVSGSAASGPIVTFNLADMPDEGWWLGNATYVFVQFAAATCRYRVVFKLEV